MKQLSQLEPDIAPSYETEMVHKSVSQFKKAMGLFPDNYKVNYVLNTQSQIWVSFYFKIIAINIFTKK